MYMGVSLEAIKDYLASNDMGWIQSDARHWYSSEGFKHFSSIGHGNENYLSDVLQYYAK